MTTYHLMICVYVTAVVISMLTLILGIVFIVLMAVGQAIHQVKTIATVLCSLPHWATVSVPLLFEVGMLVTIVLNSYVYF